ncbi:hypothetical protein ACFH04_08295 [Streptomyces noboritoensis]|uniref:Glycine zipper domain-containing protein n=1 Tax=Streptomyces noboritoensis TaxID=67337 RepID=A0ABV6TD36_9ACTN
MNSEQLQTLAAFATGDIPKDTAAGRLFDGASGEVQHQALDVVNTAATAARGTSEFTDVIDATIQQAAQGLGADPDKVLAMLSMNPGDLPGELQQQLADAVSGLGGGSGAGNALTSVGALAGALIAGATGGSALVGIIVGALVEKIVRFLAEEERPQLATEQQST